jgi:hypothetical protein
MHRKRRFVLTDEPVEFDVQRRLTIDINGRGWEAEITHEGETTSYTKDHIFLKEGEADSVKITKTGTMPVEIYVKEQWDRPE